MKRELIVKGLRECGNPGVDCHACPYRVKTGRANAHGCKRLYRDAADMLETDATRDAKAAEQLRKAIDANAAARMLTADILSQPERRQQRAKVDG